MKKIDLLKLDGSSNAQVDFPKGLWAEKPAHQAMFTAVISENASLRQGTHSTLTKAEVRGGGKKPWMQKHTGKARQGSTRNPHWVGGGVAFGPKPNRNYILEMNRKETRQAFRSALTVRVDDIYALEDAVFTRISTRSLNDFLKTAKLQDTKVLVVVEHDAKMIRSASNLPLVTAKTWKQVSTRDVLNAKKIIIQQGAFARLEEVVK